MSADAIHYVPPLRELLVPSGVILLLIVAMWAAVLIPAWLRRHQAATEAKSVDTFSAAMRVLSRRSPGRRDFKRPENYVLMPRRSTPSVSVDVPRRSAPPKRAPKPAPTRAQVVARRRRTLGGLAGTTLFLFAVAFAIGGVLWFLQLFCDGLLIAYLVHLRAEARRQPAKRPAARTAALPEPQPERRPRSEPRPAEPPAAAAAATPAPAAAAAEEWPSWETDTDVLPRIPAEAEPNNPIWQPVPVPPPTYVDAPVIAGPDYGSLLNELRIFDDEPDEILEPEGEEIDEIIERRRAVGD